MRFLIAACALIFSCVGLLAQNGPKAPSWLYPSDAVIAKAIDDGFSQKKLAKGDLYHQIRVWLKPGLDAQMEILPPLVCAMNQGQNAYAKLQPKPSVDSVKALCSGHLTVVLVHYSQNLKANWPCVLQRGDQTLQSSASDPDNDPKVVTYWPGFPATEDVAGYRYYETHSFDLDEGWLDKASVTFANEFGVHKSYDLDFSVFQKDYAHR